MQQVQLVRFADCVLGGGDDGEYLMRIHAVAESSYQQPVHRASQWRTTAAYFC